MKAKTLCGFSVRDLHKVEIGIAFRYMGVMTTDTGLSTCEFWYVDGSFHVSGVESHFDLDLTTIEPEPDLLDGFVDWSQTLNGITTGDKNFIISLSMRFKSERGMK